MSATSAASDVALSRRLAAEALGTAFLVAGVVGSGIMAQRLAHDPATALLCNTIATGAILFVLIAILAPVSRAHFNPAVTLVSALRREMGARDSLAYVCAQIAGGIAGTFMAHAMFGLPLFVLGTTARSGAGQLLGEAVATFGLVMTIGGSSVYGARLVAPAVAAYIAAAYWFTSSTSFANPAVTIARALTPTYAGIRPFDALFFVGAQFAGALLGMAVSGWLFKAPLAHATKAAIPASASPAVAP
jgi:glycerol uptake facilitator-like aquaporin